MSEILPPLVAAVVGLLGALTTYIKVSSDRKKTAVSRDNTTDKINERLAVLENRVENLSEIKDDVKAMKESFDKLLGFLQAKFGTEGFKI